MTERPKRSTRARAPRPRDREATHLAIVDAACETLARDGFAAFGINEIARRARCDKQLIYRYFGGLDGLVDAVGERVAQQITQALEAQATPRRGGSYAALAETLLLALLEVFRTNALLRQITAWELADRSALVERLVLARSRPLQAWTARLFEGVTPPQGVDAGATNALLIGAVQQLALGAAGTGKYSGLSLKSEADWERARTAVAELVRRAYAPD